MGPDVVQVSSRHAVPFVVAMCVYAALDVLLVVCAWISMYGVCWGARAGRRPWRWTGTCQRRGVGNRRRVGLRCSCEALRAVKGVRGCAYVRYRPLPHIAHSIPSCSVPSAWNRRRRRGRGRTAGVAAAGLRSRDVAANRGRRRRGLEETDTVRVGGRHVGKRGFGVVRGN
ncbi:hypothetical protein BJ912DRAFT_1007996 [Pholiota molesta]|nr:hypothetical protein BJ912DRAFT_1007996 [Pholiota molesta]